MGCVGGKYFGVKDEDQLEHAAGFVIKLEISLRFFDKKKNLCKFQQVLLDKAI